MVDFRINYTLAIVGELRFPPITKLNRDSELALTADMSIFFILHQKYTEAFNC